MTLVALKLPPGVLANGTPYQSKGYWRDAQLMRFREGVIRPVGGWATLAVTGATVTGAPRAVLGWRVQGSNSSYLMIGTHSHIYSFVAGVLTDRSIGDLSAGNVDTTVTGNLYGAGDYGAGLYGAGDPAQNAEVNAGLWHLDTFGSYLLGVLAPSDGRLLIWDTVTSTMQPVSNVAGVGTLTVSGGNLANTETVTIGTKTYTFQTTLTNVNGNVWLGANDEAALANLASAINLTAGAGTAYAAAMTKHTLVSAVSTATTLVVTQLIYSGASVSTTQTCAHATWGDTTLENGVTGDAPTSNSGLVVTQERFLFALGAGGDPRRIEWPSQESLTDWTPASTNTAGGFTLPGTGRIVCGRRGRNETLIFTESDAFSAQYIGGTLLYAFTQLGSGCGIIGPNAVAVTDGRAVWMGSKSFYVYDGFVRPIPSEVSDYVFSNFNRSQRVKCWAETRADQGEVWFHYPSALATECDRYVIWNYTEDHWTPGQLARTAGTDKGAFTYPVLAAYGGTLYEHENGTAHSGETAPYLESGPVEIGDGDQVMSVLGLIHDIPKPAGQSAESAKVRLYSSLYPTATETDHGLFSLATPVSLRVTARQVRVRVEELTAGDWRLGTLRLDVKSSGRR